MKDCCNVSSGMAFQSISQYVLRRYGIDLDNVEYLPQRVRSEYIEFIQHIFITEEEERVEIPVVPQDREFEDVLSNSRKLLIAHGKVGNILCDSVVGDQRLMEMNQGTVSTGGSGEILNRLGWRVLNAVMGPQAMTDIVVNCCCFLVTDGKRVIQAFGTDIIKRKKTFPTKKAQETHISIDSVLYRIQKHPENPIPLNLNLFLKELFGEKINKKSIKSSPLTIAVLRKISKHHERFRYNQAFNQIIDATGALGIDQKVPKRLIIKFCHLVFSAIFPPYVYGFSFLNKSMILKNISRFVQLSKGQGFSHQEITKGLKSKLRKGSTLDKSFVLRFNIWMFECFLPKLLTSFLYATNISSSNEVVFYLRKTWLRQEQEFGELYVDSYLSVSNDSRNEGKDVDGRLRIFPKKSTGFRAINIPWKGRTEEERLLVKQTKKYKLQPIQRIFSSMRNFVPRNNTVFPRIKSLNELPSLLKSFKMRLMRKFDGMIPDIHYVQFDAEACYDNIARDKVDKIIRDIIDVGETYSLKTNDSFSSITEGRCKTKLSGKLGDPSDVSANQLDLEYACDSNSSEVVTMEGSVLLNCLLNQLHNATVTHKGKIFTRTKGVFQGLNFSSVFNDILYDRLIEEQFLMFSNEDSLVLRFADDFLILCLNYNQISEFKKLLQEGFKDYGVFPNRNKTRVSSTPDLTSKRNSPGILSFCGYEIHTTNLEVLKVFGDDAGQFSIKRSHSEVVRQLKRMVEVKLNYNTLDSELNSIETNRKQVELLVSSIAATYVSWTANLQVSAPLFLDLLCFLKVRLSTRIGSLKDSNEISRDLDHAILDSIICLSFRRAMSTKQFKYGSLLVELGC
ncbi:hypothetical protein WICPIJ_004189 [Wickerhamomyces pijperi]|uniref:Telomerase reverse transcriptase n=1 Tax=Wickerhamomyces pijperi TaxID=599730 RepID=A0A9P8Q6C5_WICPI|nr:hypothetical protein WICPIJ_004189 [Wickerhamomyces pijperi]